MQKRRAYILISVVIIVAVAAVVITNQVNKNTNDTKSDASTYTIGWIGPVTGPSAVLGMDSAQAAQIAVDNINQNGGIDGKQLQLIVEDDQYNTTKAVSAYHKLVNIDNVDVIIMQTYGAVFAVSDLAKEDEVLIIDSLDCNKQLAELGDHVFCLATETESIAYALADRIKQDGHNTIAMLYSTRDTFMPYIAQVMEQELDGTVVSESYTVDTNDFRSTLSKMKTQNVDALVLLGHDETGVAMRQAQELGFDVQFYTTGTVTSPSLQELAQGNAEGTLFAFWEAPVDESFTNDFKQQFVAKIGRPPILDLASYPTYDAVQVIAEGYKQGATDARSLQRKLKNDVMYNGVTGNIEFATDGSYAIPESVYRLVNGQAASAN